jgi:CxxC-x17-CxxC domain-containing protein
MSEESKKEINIFAETNFRSIKRRFGIKIDDRRRHMYLIGRTGTGKSTTLENMIVQDILDGRGVAVVDPHGDLVEKVINYVPTSRINDVIYLNPSDFEYPIAFNVLENVNPEYRHLVVSGLLNVFKKIWADSWGPRLEYILNNALLALLEYPGSTLLGVMRILVDKDFRNKVIDKISDPIVKSFWTTEYPGYSEKLKAEAISPIQNKVGRFLSSSMMRNIIGQVKSSIDLRKIMDEKKILLLNLAKGRIGEDNSALLGAMIITKIQLTAMSRVDIPEDQRSDFYLYVDEFQNFATESFANILSEARKYHLNLIMAHQYIEQLDEKVRAAVFGNVGTLVCFRVGAEDAEFLAKEFVPKFDETDLVNLANFEMYLKLCINGVPSDPFSARGLPPLPKDFDKEVAGKIIKVTRERNSTPRAEVEEKISRWTFAQSEAAEKEREEKSTKPKREGGKDFPCDNCGTNTTLFFEPDLSKPIYCKDCLKLAHDGKLSLSRKPKKAGDSQPAGPGGSGQKLGFSQNNQSNRERQDFDRPARRPESQSSQPRRSVSQNNQNQTRTALPSAPKSIPQAISLQTALSQPVRQFNSREDRPKNQNEPINTSPVKTEVDQPSNPQTIKPGQIIEF